MTVFYAPNSGTNGAGGVMTSACMCLTTFRVRLTQLPWWGNPYEP